MWLYKDTFVSKYDGTRDNLRIVGVDVDESRVSSIREEIGYWRKANSIHRWFVANCQNGIDECQSAHVDRAKLEDLLVLVNQVLDNPELGPDILPTTAGFFFGDTDYNEWYIQDLTDTKKILEDALSDPEAYFFIYQSSW